MSADFVLQSIIFQATAKNWIHPVPEKHEEGQAWIKLSVPENGPLYHHHNETKDLYRAEPNDWAVAKTIGVVLAGEWYYWAAHLRHLGSGVIETVKSVKTIYDGYQAFKGEEGFNKTTYFATCLFGKGGQNSSFKTAFGEFKQATKDYAAMLLFSADPVVGIPVIGNIPVGTVLRAGFIAHSVFAPLNSRVLFNKLETWWRPEGVRLLTDREVANLSVWQSIKHLTDGSYSLSHLFKTNRMPLPKQELVEEEKPKTE